MTRVLHAAVPESRVSRRFAGVAFATSAVVVAASIAFTGSSATATGDGSAVGTEEVLEALQNVQGNLVKDPIGEVLPAVPVSGGDGAQSEVATLDVAIPQSAADGVTMSVGDFSLNIGLPNADAADESAELTGGSVVYPSEESSANVVIPTASGVQLLSVIGDEEASESYAYDLSMPAGHRLEAAPEGGAQIIDEQGTVKVEFEPAWAKDAAGRDVPTRYTASGTTLTQIVDHKGVEGVTYPVVADPLPVVVIVITAAAMIVVAAAALGVATWLVVSWWNTCRAMNKWPELSTKNGFTARCVR